ncbi:MAG: FG-GAP-like repeat-containing protein [bacterium]
MSAPFYLKLKFKLLLWGILLTVFPINIFAQNEAPKVLSNFTPSRFSLQNDSRPTIQVPFDSPLDESTVTDQSILVFGNRSGFHRGTIAYNAASNTISFDTVTPYEAGEMVTVVLTPAIKGANGVALSASFQWAFYIQATTGTAKFKLDSAYAAGDGPHYVEVGNFNNDNKLDIAVPHSRSNDVFTWTNLDSGIFQQRNVVGVGNRPRALTSGDLDSDGDLDLAVVSESQNSVVILSNDGTGTFTNDTTLTAGNGPAFITNGDINGDGFLDLVTVNGNDNSITVHFNQNGSSFQAGVPFAVDVNPQEAYLGDFDNDGSLDVVVSNSDTNTVSLLFNDGTGNFLAARNFTVGRRPHSIEGQDLNGDGRLDVVVANRLDDNVTVLFNIGGAAVFSLPSDFAAGNDPIALTTGDWDGDLDVDFVVSNKNSSNMQVFLNNGAGFFTQDSLYATGQQPRGINSGDFNGDGVLDLGVANWSSDTLQIFLNAFRQPENLAPEAPALIAPNDLFFFNPDSESVILTWRVPVDTEGDLLHFVIEIAQSASFVSPTIYDSRADAGFSPAAPYDQNTATVSFDLPKPAADGVFWWRVSAWDGGKFSVPSQPRRYKVDGTRPNIDAVVMTAADLLPNWYNPGTTGAIDFGVQYDENNALRAEFDLGVFGQVSQNITSGQNRIIQVPVNLTGAADGQYALSVTIIDSVGNRSSTDTEIRLDNTPPVGAFASSPQNSSSPDFQVSWGSGASDGSGVGVEGFEVRVQINNGPWQSWRTTSVLDTSAIYPGEHGNQYGFEAIAFDSLGNRPQFSETAQTVTVVDTTSDDVTAPAAPISLTVNGQNPSPWQNSAQFEIQWQAPADASGIGRAFYKLGDAPLSNNDFSGTISDTTATTVSVQQEDGQFFHLWFEDQRGNVDFQNHSSVLLRYDATSPKIVELDLINPDLLPNWYNPSQRADMEVEINYDELHLQQLTLQVAGLDSIDVRPPRSGLDIFETLSLSIQNKEDGQYNLTFILTDSAGNSTRLDTMTILLDQTGPIGTVASSPATSAIDSFMVSWSGTGTDGNGVGLTQRYDVQYQVDGGPWQPWLTDFTSTFKIFKGENGKTYGFEVVAYDLLGNRETFHDTAETATLIDIEFVDVTAPTIFHTSPLVVEEGQKITLQAVIEDDIQITEASLFYRASGDVSFKSVAMSDSGNGNFQVTLPSEEISVFGINYFIEATDGSNFAYHPTSNWTTVPNNLSVRISGSNEEGLRKNQPQPGGDQDFFYRMISVPLNLENKDPLAVLEDDLGAYDPQNWRLFQYVTSSDSYSEYPQVSAFSPGSAFWLIVRAPDKVLDSGIGTTVVTNQPFQITLNTGWTDFGLPFNFPVDWSNVQVVLGNASDIMGPYTYQEEWLLPNQITTLQPWEGYTVYSQADNVILEILPIKSVSLSNLQMAMQKAFGGTDWQLNIEAYSGSLKDRSNYLGVAENARLDRDAMDYLEPPFIADFVSLRFPHPDWQMYHGRFTTDFRPPFEEGQIWQFEVESSVQNEPVHLKFQHLDSLPSELRIVLLDKTTRQKITISQNPEYRYLPLKGESLREFELFVGSEEFIESSQRLQELVPQSFALSQNYPNPFNAGTTMTYQVSEPTLVEIQVLNILGQIVRELVSEKKQPGVYRVHWDATADAGIPIGSGVYLVKFKAGSFQQIRKIVLVR